MKMEALDGDCGDLGTCSHIGDDKAYIRVGILPTHGIPPELFRHG